MARSPFNLYKRKNSASGLPIYYVRFWDYELGKYQTAVSVDTLANMMDLRPWEFPSHLKASAMQVALKYHKEHGFQVKRERVPEFSAFLLNFWDWETSDYVRSKLARDPGSIGMQYCKACQSWVRRYICPAFEGKRLNQITEPDLDRVFVSLKESGAIAARTINLIMQAVRIPCTVAFRTGLIATNPMANIRRFGVEQFVKGILSNEEVAKLMALAWPDQRGYLAFLVALFGGLRIGEVQALRIEAVYTDHIVVKHSWNKCVGLKETKNRKSRIVPLPGFVIQKLKCLAKENPFNNSWIFYSTVKTEVPMDIHMIENSFNDALERIGIPKDAKPEPSPKSRQGRQISFHSLRHWNNATLRGALPDEKLRMLTGHSSVEMSNHYDHVTEHDIEAIKTAQEQRILPLCRNTTTQADKPAKMPTCASRKRSKSSGL